MEREKNGKNDLMALREGGGACFRPCRPFCEDPQSDKPLENYFEKFMPLSRRIIRSRAAVRPGKKQNPESGHCFNERTFSQSLIGSSWRQEL
ncbi:MAG: hypothetical protein RDV48_20505 [Candidatus Eremiobacteraeota bacterium]|nr:hypothetical protein [Candidatus Eremiobacteraeota bacterium]